MWNEFSFRNPFCGVRKDTKSGGYANSNILVSIRNSWLRLGMNKSLPKAPKKYRFGICAMRKKVEFGYFG